jgi:L-malate glycosyltransferase
MSKKPIDIHQFSHGLSYGDAISNYAVELMKLLRSWGYESEIYVIFSDSRVSKYCKLYTSYQHQPHNVLIYHYGTASELTPFLLNWSDRLVVLSHGMTPPSFFAEDFQMFKLLNQAREDLKRLSVAPHAVGDSDYNCRELQAFGFRDVRTLPYLLNLRNLDKFSNNEAERQILHQLADDYVNILFIGRIAPNKRQDDLIRLLAYYQNLINSRARLLLVGSASPAWYKAMLEIQAERLGVAKDVHFVGHLELKDGFTAYYKSATVFLSMSEHEGFGVPLLESMYFDVPVIAYTAAAVPETMGDAGILITEKRYEVIGELVNLVASDKLFREKIIRKQRDRLQDFDRSHLEKLFRDWILNLQEKFN